MQKGLLVAEMGLKIKLAVVFVVAAFFTVATSENELLDKKGFAANFDIDTIERGCDCGENSADCYLDLNGVQMCNCTSGYAQLNDSCSECDCGRRSRGCHFDADGNKVCECKRGYFQRFEKCEECDCGGGSTSCRFDQYGVKICNCSSLFARRNGTCTETCFSDRHCKGRAVCRMGEGGAANFCECPPNYEGEDCEINSLCNRIKPSCYSRGATCEIIDSTAFCRCKPEAAPDLATGLCLYICTFDKCLHGKCEVVGLGYRCKCDDGYTGHRCETKIRSEFNLLQFVVLVSTNAVIILLLLGILCLACRRRDKNFV